MIKRNREKNVRACMRMCVWVFLCLCECNVSLCVRASVCVLVFVWVCVCTVVYVNVGVSVSGCVCLGMRMCARVCACVHVCANKMNWVRGLKWFYRSSNEVTKLFHRWRRSRIKYRFIGDHSKASLLIWKQSFHWKVFKEEVPRRRMILFAKD